MKTKLVLITIIIISNLVWGYYFRRERNGRLYERTHICALQKVLNYKKTFNNHERINDIKTVLTSRNIQIDFSFSNNGLEYYSIIDESKPCPESGRPYCGVMFVFKDSLLSDIIDGYPCH